MDHRWERPKLIECFIAAYYPFALCYRNLSQLFSFNILFIVFIVVLMGKGFIIYVLWIFLYQILSEKSLKLKRVESPDRKVLFYFDEVIS